MKDRLTKDNLKKGHDKNRLPGDIIEDIGKVK
jgi:hypothetical protein